MPPPRRTMAAVALLASLAAPAQDGLKPPADTSWPRWQARVERLGSVLPYQAAIADAAAAASGARVFGDYYLFDLPSVVDGFAGGVRATTGLTVGARGLATGMPPGAGGSGLAWRDRGHHDGSDAASAPLPYLGLGFTGLSLRGGWGISADIGLAGYGSGLRPARSADLNAAEDVLRDLRLAPVLQLGVSYSF